LLESKDVLVETDVKFMTENEVLVVETVCGTVSKKLFPETVQLEDD
jgi:hypothetical protein